MKIEYQLLQKYKSIKEKGKLKMKKKVNTKKETKKIIFLVTLFFSITAL